MADVDFDLNSYLKDILEITNNQYVVSDYTIPYQCLLGNKLSEYAINYTDLTNVKSSEIADKIMKNKYFKIENFSLSLENIAQNSLAEHIFLYNLKIWEKIDGINYQIKFDKRFSACDWAKNFTYKGAEKLKLDTVVEIVRWLQSVEKLKAFL